MDSITRIKEFIKSNFPNWEKISFSEFQENIDFRTDWSELYKINNEEIILISYTNISITGTDRPKPQLRVFLDENLSILQKSISYVTICFQFLQKMMIWQED